MDASWLQGRLDHLQRDAQQQRQQQQQQNFLQQPPHNSSLCDASSMQDDDSGMQCDEDVEFYQRNNQNINALNFATPPLQCGLKRGRMDQEVDQDEGWGPESDMRDRQRLRVMAQNGTLSCQQTHRPDQLLFAQSGLNHGFGNHQNHFSVSMEM